MGAWNSRAKTMRMGTYAGKALAHIMYVHVNHTIIKNGVGTYTGMGAYLGHYVTTTTTYDLQWQPPVVLAHKDAMRHHAHTCSSSEPTESPLSWLSVYHKLQGQCRYGTCVRNHDSRAWYPLSTRFYEKR